MTTIQDIHEFLIRDAYEALGRLKKLPEELATNRKDLTKAQDRMQKADKRLYSLEKGVIQAAGGWSALGKNDKERELALSDLLDANQSYQAILIVRDEALSRVRTLRDQLDSLKEEMSALRSRVRLLTALLATEGEDFHVDQKP